MTSTSTPIAAEHDHEHSALRVDHLGHIRLVVHRAGFDFSAPEPALFPDARSVQIPAAVIQGFTLERNRV